MSIINQTLKELDKRRAQESPHRVRSRYVESKPARPLLWLLPLLAVAGLGFSWWLSSVSAAPLQAEMVSPVQKLEQRNQTEQTEPEVLVTVTQLRAESSEPEPEPIEVEQPVAPLIVAESPKPEIHEPEQAKPPEPLMRIERVEHSTAELADLRYQQALVLMDQGQARRAEELLQEALVLQPLHEDARSRLAAHLYSRGFTQAAFEMLSEGLVLQPDSTRFIMLKARLYEDRGNMQAALRTLTDIPASEIVNQDIRVLRAALANEIGDYQQAAADYRALLSLNTEQGLWWLGLAVAEEGRGDLQAAYTAYQQALNNRGLDSSSREFAHHRQEALR